MNLWPCADFPEFIRLAGQRELTQSLLAETGGGEAFAAKAAELVRMTVLLALPVNSASYKRLLDFRRQGYDDSQLSYALALAWLEGNDHFSLPRRGCRERFSGTVALLLISVVSSLGLLVGAMLGLRVAYPDEVAELLSFAPLLGLVAWIIATLLFWVLRKLAKPG